MDLNKTVNTDTGKEDPLVVSELRYRRLFETAQDGILLIDFDTGMILDVNPFLVDMLGYSKDDFLEKHLWEIGVFKDVAASKDNFSILQKKRYVRFEDLPLETKTGKQVDVEFVANAYQVDGTTIIQCNIRDITDRKRAEYTAKVSELRYRRLFETAQDGILLIDFDTGMILDVNPFLIDLLGYSKDDFLKKHLWEVGGFKDIAASKDNFSILQKKRYVRFEDLPLETKTGKQVDVEFVANAYQVDGTTIIQCNIRDITDRKRADQLAMDKVNEIKMRDEAILDSIGDAVFATDKDGKILLFNKMAGEMTGISTKEAIGSHYSQTICFIKESDGKPCNDFISEAIKNNKITKMSNHVLLVRKDGRKIPVADSAAPIKDAEKNIIGCVVVFHDVSKERQIDKAKTEFVSLASHQLRTPLSTINWYVEMLLSLDVGKLTPKQRQYSQEVYHASQRMVNLVNALLNVSRLELGTFAIEPELVNVINIAKVCLNELKPQILKRKLVVTEKYDKDIPLVKVDPKLLGIIFQNLLSNSIKYSKSGGKIGLTINKEKNNALIAVSDNGIGIPVSQQKEIFGKLFRADNAKKVDPDGSGLGLYIVKEIIHYTGGKVWFESTEGEGTTFYVNLPLSGMLKKSSNKGLI